MPNRFTPIQPGTDASQQLAIINRNFGELDNESVTKLFYDVNGIPSISIGVQQDRTSRIRIAKAGVDVTRAADSELAFNSSQNVFKIIATATVSIAAADFAASGNAYLTQLATKVIPHGQSFRPIGLGFLENALTEDIPLPYYNFNYDTGALAYQVIARVDDTALYIEVRSTAVLSPAIPIRYYILQETAR